MTYISYVSLVDVLAIIAVLVVIFVAVIMHFANRNRVSRFENSDGEKLRNKYGETHEMWDLRVSRYWEELRQIEKRQNHLMKLIRISEWKPR